MNTNYIHTAGINVGTNEKKKEKKRNYQTGYFNPTSIITSNAAAR